MLEFVTVNRTRTGAGCWPPPAPKPPGLETVARTNNRTVVYSERIHGQQEQVESALVTIIGGYIRSPSRSYGACYYFTNWHRNSAPVCPCPIQGLRGGTMNVTGRFVDGRFIDGLFVDGRFVERMFRRKDVSSTDVSSNGRLIESCYVGLHNCLSNRHNDCCLITCYAKIYD